MLRARVIAGRVRTGIQTGAGSDDALARAIRAHANFAEQVPLALLLIVLAERPGPPRRSFTRLASRSSSPALPMRWGLSRSLGPTPPRQAGAALTVLAIVAASLLIFYGLVVLRA